MKRSAWVSLSLLLFATCVFAQGSDIGQMHPEAVSKAFPKRGFSPYAGYMAHTDHHIGRLLDSLAQSGELDNTLIFLYCWRQRREC